MFIHLGGDIVVPKDQVVAIFNTNLMKKTEVNREFMQIAQNEGFILPITDREKAKSVIITTEHMYLSPISSMTLKKRSDNILDNIEELNQQEPW